MASKDKKPKESERERLVPLIKNPLAYIVFFTCVIEGVLFAALAQRPSSDRTFLIHWMVYILALSAASVFGLIFFRPEAVGLKPRPKPKAAPKKSASFAVGVTVRVREAISEKKLMKREGAIVWQEEMNRYLGRQAKIIGIDEDPPPLAYLLDIDERQFRWAPEWLEIA